MEKERGERVWATLIRILFRGSRSSTRQHWIIYVPGIVLSILIIGLVLILAAWIRSITTEIAVTNKRVIIKTGWITRRTLEMNLAKIENIGVDQGLIGRILGYGSITVVGTGGTRELFQSISDPFSFRKAVQAQTYA
jgi:uncharacterized membrane protein YdbT with pleckstrin-like domain